MSLVKFDINSFSSFEKGFRENNHIVLENIEIINNELKEIKEILNTPNSLKTIPSYTEYLDNIETFIKENDVKFDKRFETIKAEYGNFLYDVQEKVGG